MPNRLQKLLLLLIPLLQISLTLDCKPFGIRLSFGTSVADPSSDQKLSLRFDTKLACEKSFITVQKGGSSIRKIYCDNFRLGFQGYVGYVHRCSIVDLGEGEEIGYMVFGWTGNISDPQIPYTSEPISYYFPKATQEFKLVSLADWSYLRQFRTKYKPLDDSFAYLLKTDPKIRGLFINGDIAYDLQSNKGRNYEDFLGMISQVSGNWPVIVNPGNHEHRDQNFYVLRNAFEVYGFGAEGRRVVMLKLPWFNFILFDPYQILYNKEPQNYSYTDFKKQLDLSHQSQTLTILASHYPFRCNGELKDCQTKHQQMSQFFSAMFATNVPLYLGAHFHAYERHYPFKSDGSFIKTSQIQWKFDQPQEERRLISVVEGAGGNDVSIVEGADEIGEFTAAYSYNVTGYGIVKINELRLSYSHYISSNPSTPVDFFEMFLKRYPKKQLRVE